MRRRVAVTGLGVLAPNGLGVEEFAAEMLAGRPAISRIGRFCADAYASQIAGHLPNDPAPYGATERSVEDLRFVRLALTSAKEALEDAGIDGDFVDGHADDDRALCRVD
jgi:3-oxoacyl-(acyl-carrier-protein) synthase